MKTLISAAVLACATFTASAQTPASKGGSGSAAQRASTSNADTPSPAATTTAPNYSPGNGQKTGRKVNTAPATGAIRLNPHRANQGRKAGRDHPNPANTTGKSAETDATFAHLAGPKSWHISLVWAASRIGNAIRPIGSSRFKGFYFTELIAKLHLAR